MLEEVTPEEGSRGYTVMEIDEKLVENLAERHGIETIMGKPGGVAFIHCNLVHGSSTNISPWPRAILYINYNSVAIKYQGSQSIIKGRNQHIKGRNQLSRAAISYQGPPDLSEHNLHKIGRASCRERV